MSLNDRFACRDVESAAHGEHLNNMACPRPADVVDHAYVVRSQDEIAQCDLTSPKIGYT